MMLFLYTKITELEPSGSLQGRFLHIEGHLQNALIINTIIDATKRLPLDKSKCLHLVSIFLVFRNPVFYETNHNLLMYSFNTEHLQ
jgi:hypothetical protein